MQPASGHHCTDERKCKCALSSLQPAESWQLGTPHASCTPACAVPAVPGAIRDVLERSVLTAREVEVLQTQGACGLWVRVYCLPCGAPLALPEAHLRPASPSTAPLRSMPHALSRTWPPFRLGRVPAAAAPAGAAFAGQQAASQRQPGASGGGGRGGCEARTSSSGGGSGTASDARSANEDSSSR